MSCLAAYALNPHNKFITKVPVIETLRLDFVRVQAPTHHIIWFPTGSYVYLNSWHFVQKLHKKEPFWA